MNEHFASVVHKDKTAAWFGEADASRLAARSTADRPSGPGSLPLSRRILAAVLGLIAR